MEMEKIHSVFIVNIDIFHCVIFIKHRSYRVEIR